LIDFVNSTTGKLAKSINVTSGKVDRTHQLSRCLKLVDFVNSCSTLALKMRTAFRILATQLVDDPKKLVRTKEHPPPHGTFMDYVVAYPENLRTLIDLGLTPRQFKVLLHILDAMGWGNLIGFSQKAACDALKIDKTTMSKIFKSLTGAGVLVKIEGHTYLNSNLFAKGLSQNTYSQTAKRLANAAVTTSHIKAARPAAATSLLPTKPIPAAPAAASVESVAISRRVRVAKQKNQTIPVRRSAIWSRPDGRVKMPL
jgi:hypothetical protein